MRILINISIISITSIIASLCLTHGLLCRDANVRIDGSTTVPPIDDGAGQDGMNARAGSLWITLLLGCFNPLAATAKSRVEDLAPEASKFDFSALTGFQRSSPPGLPPSSATRIAGKSEIEAGWAPGPVTNKRTGCMFMLGKRVAKPDEKSVWSAPQGLRGRLLGCHIVNWCWNVGAPVAYFLPLPCSAKAMANYEKTCQYMVDWIEASFSAMAARTVPCLLWDLNDGTGRERRGKQTIYLDTSVVSEEGATTERRKKGASALLRKVLEKHHMCNASFSEAAPSWLGEGEWKSRTDYVFVPEECRPPVQSAGPLPRMGKRIQAVRTKRLKEHAPFHCKLRYDKLGVARTVSEDRDKWCQDSLMQGIIKGHTKEGVLRRSTQGRGGGEAEVRRSST